MFFFQTGADFSVSAHSIYVLEYSSRPYCSCFEQVFVANHTSMIDFIILEQMTAFAVIMQKHDGWVGKSMPNTLVHY